MMSIRRCVCVLLLALLLLSAFSSYAQWPKVIPIQNGGKITIYQPQRESLFGVKLSGRAAVSIQKTSKDEPIFGAVFYVSTISTDKVSRTASIESVNITSAKFPGINDSNLVIKLEKLLQTELPKWNLEMSMEDLVTSLNPENVSEGTDQFKNDPPKIIYKNKPTTLVILAGDPKIQKDPRLEANRVVNTPSLIFQDQNQWHMYTGGVWYKSDSITNGWKQNSILTDKVKIVNDTIKKQEKRLNGDKEITAKPEVTDILVSTVPAELIQSKGEPIYKPIDGGSLIYISNSVNDIFKDVRSQKFYVLLSGRWYRADALIGPWSYIPGDKLPADFVNIPEASEKGNVLASVPGTAAAEEARIDAQIPQTAKVDRKTTTVKVEYDGSPLFKAIEGTSLQLAENANIPVMKDSAGTYYALDNGVWFVSNSSGGPWAVSDERPKEVEKIPASSSAYNTKYVYVYESTPEYVYTGYTPGYMGSYVYGSTVVYGTGYNYAPWYGAAYYAHPVTWGMGFSYNPWYGWGMSVGVSYNVGFMTIGFSFGGYGYGYGYGGGWYGPPIYYPPHRPPYYGGGGGNYRPGNGTGEGSPQVGHHNNLYNNHSGVSTRDVNRGPAASNRASGIGNSNRPTAQPANKVNNNIYTDRNGNTFQRDLNGSWKQRDNQSNKWNSVNQNNTRDLNRDYQNRNRANTRQQNFQQSNRAVNRGMGGGGGGRRR